MATKIMLVEDDISLSEIYHARLQAEGFEIISAKDGEEALALAVSEHPDLIICDVMMPRISGFDMLDILRGTAGIQDTKVIMMTALSQAEDKARAEKLGANRYLVKSQVTLEDVVKTVHEVLADKLASSPPISSASALTDAKPPQAAKGSMASDISEPVTASTPPEPTPTSAVDIVNDQTTDAEQDAVSSQIQSFVNENEPKDEIADTPIPEPPATAPPTDYSGHSINKIIEPVVHPPRTNIHTLVDAENNKATPTGQIFNDITPKPQNT